MDEILYLEPDEEITSVIDKIKQSKSGRLSLVIPRDATLLQSVINLRLLAKEAANLGKEIALVTSDKIGRNLAAKVGLTVYDSIKNPQKVFEPEAPLPAREEVIEINAAEIPEARQVKPKGIEVHHFQEAGSNWRKKEVKVRPAPAWQPPKVKKEIDWSKSRKIIWPMAAIVVLLVLIAAFLILPKVKVELKVKAESFQKNVNVSLSSDEAAENADKNIYGGKLIDLTKEKEEKFAATGKKNLGGKATGTITFYNNLDSNAHSLSIGTKLSSSSKTFVLKSAVSVPGATVQNLRIVPGTVSADIEAEDPGDEYNVKAGRFTIVGLPASQQEALYGQSSKDLMGGFSKEVQVVSNEDYSKAKEKLTAELTEDLKKELTSEAEGKEILENAMQIEVVEENSSAKVDSEATEFSLKIKQRLREIVFVREDFDKFIISILGKQIASDKMITKGPNDVISPQVKEKKYSEGIIDFDVSVSAKISSKIDMDKVKNDLLGKSRTDGEKYLNSLEGISSSEIKFIPSWWPIKRIPNFQKNVEVELGYVEEETPSINPSSSPEAVNE